MYIYTRARVCAQLLSRVQLCAPMDSSQPSSSVHVISQARVLEWVAISSSGGGGVVVGLSNSEIKPVSPASAGRFFTTAPPEKPIYTYTHTHTYNTYII